MRLFKLFSSQRSTPPAPPAAAPAPAKKQRAPKIEPPVHVAVMMKDHVGLVRALKTGHDVDALDREGRTALFYTVVDGRKELFDEPLRHRTDVNIRDRGGKTALHAAAMHYQPEIAERLLEAAAIVDVQDAHGNTPLWDAVFNSRNRGEVIKVLLAHGADKTILNFHGVSPEILANTIANYDAKQFLA